jgi:hypothetical protein
MKLYICSSVSDFILAYYVFLGISVEQALAMRGRGGQEMQALYQKSLDGESLNQEQDYESRTPARGPPTEPTGKDFGGLYSPHSLPYTGKYRGNKGGVLAGYGEDHAKHHHDSHGIPGHRIGRSGGGNANDGNANRTSGGGSANVDGSGSGNRNSANGNTDNTADNANNTNQRRNSRGLRISTNSAGNDDQAEYNYDEDMQGAADDTGITIVPTK